MDVNEIRELIKENYNFKNNEDLNDEIQYIYNSIKNNAMYGHQKHYGRSARTLSDIIVKNIDKVIESFRNAGFKVTYDTTPGKCFPTLRIYWD